MCRIGSVAVPKLWAIESFATVHQLVSTVSGELAEGRDCIDAARAAFPGGSMTGAPKERTMDIIAELESSARGAYAGALGFLSVCGACDLNIVIRSVVLSAHATTIGTGGAVVALSDAESEYDEMLLKARVVMGAVAGVVARAALVGGGEAAAAAGAGRRAPVASAALRA